MATDTLNRYPYVIVRLGCTMCGRRGQCRLLRLAAKYGAEIAMNALLENLAGDCAHWRPRHPFKEGCGARFVDLDPPSPPPDLPPAMRRLRLVKGRAD